jgi:hypothetical protein|nr:FlgD immunoglobulin-like domain containing protein [Candidatus Krumholzibacteria bacterium]
MHGSVLCRSFLLITLLSLFPCTPAHAWLSVVRQGRESDEVPNTDDHFGRTVCAGDFNGDGYDDLATAAPDESNGLVNSAAHGMVIISPGSPRGITTQGVRSFSVGDLGTEAARFGRSLASGDFNQDGYDDLAVGIPQLNNFGGPDRGAVWIYAGGSGGLQVAPYLRINYDDVENLQDDYANFGWALAVGDFDDDGYPDLATSAIGQDGDTGLLYFFSGSSDGLTTEGVQKMYPYTVGGPNVYGDQFGYALAAGQLDGEGGDDLVVGAPMADVHPQTNSGRVYFYFSGANGISASDAYFVDASTVVPGLAPVGDARLGFSLAVGHMFDTSGGMDVAIGAPRDDYGDQANAGSVYILGFSGQGTSYQTMYKLRQSETTNSTAASPGDQFGYSLALGRFNSDLYMDLAIGTPYEDVTEQPVLGEQLNAGMFHIVYGRPGGPSMSNSDTFDHTTINNFVRGGDNLGLSLCFGRFENDTREALAVGAPSADYVSYEQNGTDIFDSGEVFIVAPWRQPQNHPHRTSVLFDCDGFILYGQRPFQRVRPASTTKTVTLLLACEAIWDGAVDPNQFYTVPGWVADQVGGSQTPLVEGEQLSFVGLMQTMMTVSGNDSAMLIGSILSGDGGPWEGWSGTSPLFAEMMNDRLDQMGLSSATTMTNAAGIDSDDHYVTALDWATLGYLAIQNECVRTIVDTSPWIVERVLPPGTSLDFFQLEGGNGQGEISMYEAFFAGWVDGVKARYNKAVGIKPGGTPGGWSTGLSAAEPFGSLDGIAVASTFGSRRNDAPVEGVVAGSTTSLNADLLQYAEGFCSNGNPGDFLPTPDPGPQPWGTLTSIPPCQEEGVHAMTINLSEEQITAPGRLVQFDLMRGSHIAPVLPVRQMVKRLSQIELARNEAVPFGVSPHHYNEGLKVMNDGDTEASFNVLWDGTLTPFQLQPGEVATLPPVNDDTGSFEFRIQSTSGVPLTLGVTECYFYRLELADGVVAPDAHSVRLVRAGNILAESLSAYVQGAADDCDDDTLDLVARSDDGVTTGVDDDFLPPAPAGTRLLPVYPNPFNPSTTIRFDLPQAAQVDLGIYDIRGRLVKTLARAETFPTGRHLINWNGTDNSGSAMASGVYLLKLVSEGEVRTQRMTLLR